MNLFNKIILCLTLVLMTLSLTNLSRADGHSDRLDNIESQVQDALIKIKGMEKKTKDVPTIKVGPGLKIKSGKNEVKFGGRIHFDVGMHDPDAAVACEQADTSGGSCFVDGTNFRRLRLAMSGKYASMYYYKVSVDWGASAKQGVVNSSDNDAANDMASVDEAFLGYKLGKNTTLSIGKQKIPLSFAESTSSNDMPFIERSTAVDALTDHTLGPKRMSAQLRNWDKKMGYLVETAVHGAGDTFTTESAHEQVGYTGRAVYAPILQKNHVLHLGYWHDITEIDQRGTMSTTTGDATVEWDYRIGLNVSDEKGVDADFKSTRGLTDMQHYGAEIAYLNGPFWTAGEWLWGQINRDILGSDDTNTNTSYEANAGYVEAGFTINGQRRYTIKKGGWKRPKVKNPVEKGGNGVMEIGVRHTRISLNGMADKETGSMNAKGSQYSTDLMFNWQLNNNNLIKVNYIMADLSCQSVSNITGQGCGTTVNGVVNPKDGETRVNALGIRFQSNW